MENLNNNIVDNQIDDNFVFPLLNTWQDCFDRLCRLSNKLLSKTDAKNLQNNMTSLVKILIDYGNIREDVVIKTALVYYFEKITNNQVDFYLSDTIKNNLTLLKNAYTSKNFDSVFCSDIAYLNKIVLSEIILNFSTQKVDSNAYNYNKIFAQFIVKKYSKIIQNKLMKLLVSYI